MVVLKTPSSDDENMTTNLNQEELAELLQMKEQLAAQQIELQHQRQELERQRATSGTTSTSLPAVFKRPKASLPDTARYNGNNPVYFPQFLSNLKAKIAIDGQAIGNEQAQVWYAFGRLEGKASARIHPWVDRYSETSRFTTREFLELLKSTFADAAREQKALDRLNRLKQGNRSFDELLAELEQLLLEAGGHEWADPIKKGYLKGAFNRELKRHLLSLDERESYDGFKDQVKRVADRVEDFARSERSQLSWRRNASPKRPWGSLPRTSPDPPDVMEWEPTPARAAEDKKTQRAAWVSPKELEKRKERGLCFRCGASGHMVTGCPYQPARRPAKRKQQLRRELRGAGKREASVENRPQRPPVLIEDNEVTTEEWLVDEILGSMLVGDNDQRMRWYLVKWRGYDPSWQPEHDLIPGCEELAREFPAKSGKEESPQIP
ncbi:hypothetical protein ACJ73_06441 [Blastomyces percursus]|uniref:CCHC-type domain-containing protein n=1 Tax=Blastomyces percursus TaxID=1658174 RepID=A0A1J9Q0R6_9EURO|nr:hypothetical protein ACJ73_06441 [Blastomyces percursus]